MDLEYEIKAVTEHCRAFLGRECERAAARRTAESAVWEARRALFRGDREEAAARIAEAKQALRSGGML